MDELLRLARVRRVQYLAVQPPCNGEALAGALSGWGLHPSLREVEPTATVVRDLDRSEDDLLAAMKIRTRYNVRLALRKGIVVRQGTESDIPAFHRLLLATGGRQGFSPHPEEYFLRLGQRLIRAIDEVTPDGFVERVNMRLRPFGEAGPLVMSAGAMETYYQVHGREWERYALQSRACKELSSAQCRSSKSSTITW